MIFAVIIFHKRRRVNGQARIFAALCLGRDYSPGALDATGIPLRDAVNCEWLALVRPVHFPNGL